MRRAIWVVLAPLVLAGCNDAFSNDDILFLKSLPSRKQLLLEVPGMSTSSSGLREEGDPPPSPAKYYKDAVKAGTDANGAIEFVLAILDGVQKFPPTLRDIAGDRRIWGPFPGDHDAKYTVTIVRKHVMTSTKATSTSTLAPIAEYYDYLVEAQPNAQPATQLYLIAGRSFPMGTDFTAGEGWIFLNFEAGRMLDPTSNDKGALLIGYDTRFSQRTIEEIYAPDANLKDAKIGVHYEAEANGYTKMYFLAKADIIGDGKGEENVVVETRFAPDHHGRADAIVSGGSLPAGFYAFDVECWDKNFYRTFEASNYMGSVMVSGTKEACGPDFQSDIGH